MGIDVIDVRANYFLVCPAKLDERSYKKVTQDMADSCVASCIVLDIASGISFYSSDGNLVLHQMLSNPHITLAI